ncbi:MAG: tetratricopeptide repeat protein [Elusimicrobia bacterium]|nr:tetratricopeptide repeat protein [Elusimicrobiota bacterium]
MRFKKVLLSLIFVSLAAAGPVYWIWCRPSPLEKAAKLTDRGDTSGAIAVLAAALEAKGWKADDEEAMRVELARSYLMNGALENAEGQFRTVLEKFPENAYAHLGMGYLYLVKGFDSFAVESYQKARELNPEDWRASLGLAGLYVFRGEFEKAEKEYRHVLEIVPSETIARKGLARAYALSGAFSRAASEYEQVLSRLSQDLDVRLTYARTLFLSGQLVRAEQETLRILEQSSDHKAAQMLLADILSNTNRRQEAQRLYESIFNGDRQHILAGLNIALLRARRGQMEDAKALLSSLEQALPKDEPLTQTSFPGFFEIQDILNTKDFIRHLFMEYHTARARLYVMQALYTDAEREVRYNLQRQPNDIPSLRLTAELYRLKQQPDERLEWIQRALQAYPRHPYLLLDRAESLISAGRLTEAFADVQNVRAECPTLSRAAALLSEVYLGIGKTHEASEAAKEAIQLNPHDPGAYLAKGLVDMATYHYDQARKEFCRALEIDTSFARAYYELSRLHYIFKDLKAAQAAFRSAHEFEPIVYSQLTMRPSKHK